MKPGKDLMLIKSNYPKSDRSNLLRRATWIVSCTAHDMWLAGACTFCADTNKSVKAGYKSEDLTKVEQSPYNAIQKPELFAILMLLKDYEEPQYSYWLTICRKLFYIWKLVNLYHMIQNCPPYLFGFKIESEVGIVPYT